MILHQLLDLALIYNRFLEHFWAGSSRGARGKNPKRRFTESQEMELVCVRRTEMVADVKGALGFGISHHYVAARVFWACMTHITSPEITEYINGSR
jgi:hypothetical protein